MTANAETMEKNVERYCELSTALKRGRPVFDPPRGTRDAALYLAPRVDWADGRIGLLHLPEVIATRMATPPQNWKNFGPADYAGLDFGWFAELQNFDVWTVGAAGPVNDVDRVDAKTLDVDWSQLQRWVKLRLIKGLREGDLERATTEVLHLGKLADSTAFLLGKLYGATVFGLVRTVWEMAGRAPPDDLPSREEVDRFRLLAMDGARFLFPGVSRQVQLRALECGVDRCSAITEAALEAVALRGALPEAAAQVQWLTSQNACDARLLDRVVRASPAKLEDLDGAFKHGTFSWEQVDSRDGGSP